MPDRRQFYSLSPGGFVRRLAGGAAVTGVYGGAEGHAARVIRYTDELNDIARIDNIEGRKEDLKLYCARRVGQSI